MTVNNIWIKGRSMKELNCSSFINNFQTSTKMLYSLGQIRCINRNVKQR